MLRLVIIFKKKLENSKKEIKEVLKEIKVKSDDAIIFLSIDNFSSHKSDYVENIANGIKIELYYLPQYSPQLQPIERKWLGTKQNIMKYKIRYIPNFREKSGMKNLIFERVLLKILFISYQKTKLIAIMLIIIL